MNENASDRIRITGLDGRVAVVVGASGGIGSGVSRGLLAAGADLVLLGRDRGRLDRLARELDAPERVLTVAADVTDTFQLAEARDAVVDRFGRVDVVVVSAGVMLGAPFEDGVPAEWASMIGVNLGGLLNAAQTFTPELIETVAAGRPGDLVLVGAIAGHIRYPNFAVFNAVSAAIAQLARTLRSEYGGRGLRVHLVEPGFTETGFGRHLRDETASAYWSELERNVRPIDPDDLGTLVTASVALPRGLNLAEIVVVPTEQD